MPESRLKFELSLSEVNQILEALGLQPYRDVYELIRSLQEQAQQQLIDSARSQQQAVDETKEERQ